MNCIVVSSVPSTYTIVRLIESFVQCGDIKSVDVLSTEINGCNPNLGLNFIKYKIIFQSTMNMTKLFEIVEAPIDGHYMVLDQVNGEPMADFFSSSPSSSIASISTPSTINNNLYHNTGPYNTPITLEMNSYITDNERLPLYDDTVPEINNRRRRNPRSVPEIDRGSPYQGNNGLNVLRIEIFANTMLDRRRRSNRGGLIASILSMVAEPNESQNHYQGRRRGRCNRY